MGMSTFYRVFLSHKMVITDFHYYLFVMIASKVMRGGKSGPPLGQWRQWSRRLTWKIRGQRVSWDIKH